MDCRALAFRQLPHQPKLFLAYLERFEKVTSFYAHPPTIQAVTQASRTLDYPGERRREVAAILGKQSAALGASTSAVDCSLRRGAAGVWVYAKREPPRPLPSEADRG